MKISLEDGLFLGLIVLLLLLFAASLTSFLTKAPSEKISREIPIASFEYGFSKSCNCHVSVLNYPERERARVIAVDGRQTRILDLNIRGEILRYITLDLDLSRASDMEMYSPEYDHIRLYYLYKGLRNVEIDLSVQGYSEELLVEDSGEFSSFRDRIVFHRPDGLYGIVADGSGEIVKLIDGELPSFSLTGELSEGSAPLLLLYSRGAIPADTELNLAWLDEDLHIKKSRRLSLEGDAKYYRDIVDSKADHGVFSALFFLPSRRLGINEVSFLRMDVSTGELIQSFRNSYPSYKSRYRIIDSDADMLRFVHQIDDGRGVNLGVTTVDSTGRWELHPYSKTLSLSKFGGYFQAEGYDALVFSDIDYERRQLMFASAEPGIMEMTSRWSTAGFLYPFLTTLALFLVSLVTGGLYLFVSAPVPLGICALMNFFSAPFRRDGLNILSVALIHLAIKMVISYSLIQVHGALRFAPLLIGRGGLLYPVLIFSSIISFCLTIRENRGCSYRDSSYAAFYVRYGLYDYIQYVLLVLVYVTASVLLTKI